MAYKNVHRKMPPKGLEPLGWLALIGGLWISTYWVAYKFGFHPALSSFSSWFPAYLPGQVIYWAMTWGQYYPRIFVPALGVCAVSFVSFIIIVRKARKQS